MATPEMRQNVMNIGPIPHESPDVEGIQRLSRPRQRSGARSSDNWDWKARSSVISEGGPFTLS